MQFLSIKFKNIFQKIQHDKGISLSSIADKENRRISLTGRNPLVSRKNRDTNEFKRETDILSPSLSSPIDFPAIFGRCKMDDFLKLLEEESRRIVAGTESHFCDGQIRIGKQLAGVLDTDFCQHLEDAFIGGFLEIAAKRSRILTYKIGNILQPHLLTEVVI